MLVLRDLRKENEFKKLKLSFKDKYKLVKFNELNDFQYFVSGDNSFKVFDIRSHIEIDSIEEFKGALEIFNDSSNFLIAKKEALFLYNNDLEKLKEWNEFGNITSLNLKSANYLKPDVIVVGNSNGDVFVSNYDANSII